MTDNSNTLNPEIIKEQEFEGVYGPYKITLADKIEVKRYRLAVLACGMSFSTGLFHWILLGPKLAWVWLIPFAISLGLALKWIHIYLRSLHKALQIFWALGCLGITLMAFNLGVEKMLSQITNEPKWILVIGPLFAALTGLGFKEFFCFQRPEAIGVTLLVPIALLGHLTGIAHETAAMVLLCLSSILLLILAIRKFGMEAAADVGDKSVFEYLNNLETSNSV